MARFRSIASAAALLLAAAAVAGDKPVTGSFARGEKYLPPSIDGPVEASRAVVKTVTPQAGKATVEIFAKGGNDLVVWTLHAGRDAAAGVSSTLRTPSGRTLRRGEREGAQMRRLPIAPEAAAVDAHGAQEALYVDQAERGTHLLEVDAADNSAVTVVAAEPNSTLVLQTWTGPLSRQPGDVVRLNARILDADKPVTGAKVIARLAPPAGTAGRAVKLADRGDGSYSAEVRGVGAQPGMWTVRYDASGRDAEGQSFERTGSGGFMNERGAARLLPGSVRAQVEGDSLRVTADAQVTIAGSYRFDVIAAGAPAADGSREARAWGESTLKLAAGKAALSIDLPLAQVGPLDRLHLDLRLLGLDPMGVAGRLTLDVNP